MPELSASHPHIPFSQDATLVVALAGTAMPFAHSAEDEAERWLRAFRLQGEVGSALQALGVGEAPLMTGSEPRNGGQTGTPSFGAEVLDDVAGRAAQLASARNSQTVGTADLLFAVLEIYDRLFDRALYRRGASREELLERLAEAESHHHNSR